MSASALISVDKVRRQYGRLTAVHELSFTLQRGQVLGLLGPNGAGKSTTLQMVCGVLAPTSGEIAIDGVSLAKHPLRAKQRLGYLADTPPVYPEMRVVEYLTHCARLRRVAGRDVAKRVADVIERCGLGDVRRRLIGQLSKGMLQRVGIAQAIVHQPQVVVLDEPTIGLDPLQILEIRRLIRRLGDDYGVLISTHILPEVQAVCDRVLIINRGQLVYDGPPVAESAAQSARIVDARFSQAVSAEHFTELQGLTAAKARSPQHWELQFVDDAAAQRALATAVSEGLAVRSWQPMEPSLEHLFMEIVTRDEIAAAAEAEVRA